MSKYDLYNISEYYKNNGNHELNNIYKKYYILATSCSVMFSFAKEYIETGIQNCFYSNKGDAYLTMGYYFFDDNEDFNESFKYFILSSEYDNGCSLYNVAMYYEKNDDNDNNCLKSKYINNNYEKSLCKVKNNKQNLLEYLIKAVDKGNIFAISKFVLLNNLEHFKDCLNYNVDFIMSSLPASAYYHIGCYFEDKSDYCNSLHIIRNLSFKNFNDNNDLCDNNSNNLTNNNNNNLIDDNLENNNLIDGNDNLENNNLFDDNLTNGDNNLTNGDNNLTNGDNNLTNGDNNLTNGDNNLTNGNNNLTNGDNNNLTDNNIVIDYDDNVLIYDNTDNNVSTNNNLDNVINKINNLKRQISNGYLNIKMGNNYLKKSTGNNNLDNAIMFFKMASDKNHHESTLKLAIIFKNMKNDKQMVKMCKILVEQNNMEAMSMLVDYHKSKRQYKQMEKYLKILGDNNDVNALFKLANHYLLKGNDKKMIDCYEKASNLGHYFSKYELEKYYINKKNMEKLVKLYENFYSNTEIYEFYSNLEKCETAIMCPITLLNVDYCFRTKCNHEFSYDLLLINGKSCPLCRKTLY